MQTILQLFGLFLLATTVTRAFAAGGLPHHVDDKNIFITFSGYDHWATFRDIRDYQSAIQRLENTSNVIEQLIFDGEFFTKPEVANISQHIAACCANTLTAIHLQNAGEVLLTETNDTFPNVKHVHLEYSRFPDDMQVARIYPATESLRFDIKPASMSMAELLMSINPTPSHASHSNQNLRRIANVLPTMPNVENLTVLSPANTLLPSIQANLHHLYQLSITYDPTLPMNRTFHFGSVRALGLTLQKLENSTFYSIPLTFDRLETVALATPEFDDHILDWIKQNTHIKSFSSEYPLFYDHMDKLCAALGQLPELEKVSLLIIGGVNLADYLQHLGHVNQVTFTLYGVDTDALSKTIPADWRVVENWHGLWDPQITLAPVGRTKSVN